MKKRGKLVSAMFSYKETIARIVSRSYDSIEAAISEILRQRKLLEDYIAIHPLFLSSLEPIDPLPEAPEIAIRMCEAAKKAEVGPMASVAGAIAHYACEKAYRISGFALVENGGDISIMGDERIVVGLYAGRSPFSGKIGFEVDGSQTPIGICTSSGTVGPSISFGNADAVTVFGDDSIIADAVATATANRVKTRNDIGRALEFALSIDGVRGCLIVLGDQIGAAGDIPKIVKTRGVKVDAETGWRS